MAAGATPAAEFFADLPDGVDLDENQVAVVRGIRDELARRRPAFVIPAETHAREEDRYLRLVIPHAREPEVALSLLIGDGYLEIETPLQLVNGWESPDVVVAIVSAALDGRLVEEKRYRARRLVLTRVEVVRPDATCAWSWTLRKALFAGRWPWPAETSVRRSLSFDRYPAVVTLDASR